MSTPWWADWNVFLPKPFQSTYPAPGVPPSVYWVRGRVHSAKKLQCFSMWDWLDCWVAGAFIEFASLGKSIWDRLLFQSVFIDTACL